jgi:phospholipase C
MIAKYLRGLASIVTAITLTVSVPSGVLAQPHNDADDFPAKTPIKHVVVIFQENISFDHYFATYPYALNAPHEPEFHAADDTPRVNNLLSGGLLTNNPNATQPFRLDRSEAVTCDEDHNYGDEQKAFDKGLMDNFVSAVGSGDPVADKTTILQTGQKVGDPLRPGQTSASSSFCYDAGKGKGLVMGYYDGNTATAMWNYAQHFAMSDNSYSTNFGPSAVGALNLISGNTGTAALVTNRPNGSAASANGSIANGATTGPVIGDPRPGYDDCVLTNPKLQTTTMVTVQGTTIGDLLNSKGVTWGWFMGGFAPTGTSGRGGVGATGVDEFGTTRPLAVCGSFHTGLAGNGLVAQPDNVTTVGDYIPHHQPFEYYAPDSHNGGSNVQHLRPSSSSKIGQTDQARHQYDLTDFFTALKEDHLPAVSFLKTGAYQDGHPGYSDPLDEQIFVVNTINALMASDEWSETAVIILYDDSDGWYDHGMSPIVSQSTTIEHDGTVFDDNLAGPGNCGTTPPGGAAGRCGLGPRQPLLVISPWAKENYVDHLVTDQASVLRFIEDNFLDSARIGDGSTDVKAGTLNGMFDFDDRGRDGRFDREKDERHHRTLFLNPATGQEVNFGR